MTRFDTAEVTIELAHPYDLHRSLGAISDGSHDPTWHFGRSPGGERAVRAQWTPQGPVTVELVHGPAEGASDSSTLAGRFSGPGATWLAERVSWLCGLDDRPEVPNSDLHPLVAEVLATHPGFRTARSLSLLDVVVPTVLGQRVTKAEAHRSFGDLVRRHGHAAPGSDEVLLGPDASTMLRLGDADWHALGVERSRADAVRGVLRRLDALERAGRVHEPVEPHSGITSEFIRVATSLPGIGEWTATSLASVLLGDPDVVVLGDLHLPNGISWALASEPRGDDARMEQLLEPFRPQRGRVARLLKFSGKAAAPRRGPRYNPLPVRDM